MISVGLILIEDCTHIVAGLAEVDILGSVIDRMVLKVLAVAIECGTAPYMVPERSRILSIWIIVVFVLTLLSDVICIAIERTATERSVKVNGIGSVTMVNKSDDCFTTLCHLESWAWQRN